MDQDPVRPDRIYGLVLAAGRSVRMGGGSKLLLPFGRSTILETVLAAVLAAPVDETLVVFGAWRADIEPVLGRYPVRAVFNAEYERGMLSSIQTGFRAIPPGPGAVFIVPADHPAVLPADFALLLDERKKSGSGLIVPWRGNRGGHPILVDLGYRGEIDRLDPAVGLRQILAQHPGDVCRVSSPNERIFNDIDTPADYRRADGGTAKRRTSG